MRGKNIHHPHPTSTSGSASLHRGSVALYIFLAINDVELTAPEAAAVAMMFALAAGEIGEPEVAVWLRESCLGGG